MRRLGRNQVRRRRPPFLQRLPSPLPAYVAGRSPPAAGSGGRCPRAAPPPPRSGRSSPPSTATRSASPSSICGACASPGLSPSSPTRGGRRLAGIARPSPVSWWSRLCTRSGGFGWPRRPAPVLSRCSLALAAVRHVCVRQPGMLLLSLALRSSLRSSWLSSLMGYGGGWPTCSGCEVEEALPGENFIDDDGCSRHFSFLKASSLALFPSPQALRSREKSRTRGSPCRMVSTSLRRFLLGGIFLDFFCFGWTRLLLPPLHLGFDPWLAIVLGDSSGACLDILGWPRRHAALRPRRRYTGAMPFGLGGLLSLGFAGAHRCRRTNSAIRRPSFVPVMFHCELLLWCPSFSP